MSFDGHLKWVLPFVCFKSEYEGIFVVVAVSFTSEIKIEGDKEACNSEEGHDRETFWMVVERMANEIRMAPDGGQSSQDQWQPPLSCGKGGR